MLCLLSTSFNLSARTRSLLMKAIHVEILIQILQLLDGEEFVFSPQNKLVKYELKASIVQQWHYIGIITKICTSYLNAFFYWKIILTLEQALVVTPAKTRRQCPSSSYDNNFLLLLSCFSLSTSFLHGSMIFPYFAGMHILAMYSWPTVSSKDMKPSSISSACYLDCKLHAGLQGILSSNLQL